MIKSLESFLVRHGLLWHDLSYYGGFAGVPGYVTCFRCGQPWKDLGVRLETDGECPGSEYRKEMRVKTEALWRERLRRL